MGKKRTKAAPTPLPADVPLYTPWDVARYLHIPIWAVAALTGRSRGWPEPELFFRHFWHGSSQLLLRDDDLTPLDGAPGDRSRIPFRRFAELFVRAGVIRVLAEWPPAGQVAPERWENLHHLTWRGLEDTYQTPIPFDGSPAEDRAASLAEPFVRPLSEPMGAFIRKHLTLRLDRVEAVNGVPVRLYPPSREPGDVSPRTIVLDPLVRFGRPVIAGRGVPTDSLFERYQAGDSPAELAQDYDLAAAEVDEAIRYESRPAVAPFPSYGW